MSDLAKMHNEKYKESRLAGLPGWGGSDRVANADVAFEIADVTNLSNIPSRSFDIVFDGNCLHCLIGEKRNTAFQEIYRVLKPNGILFVSSLSASQSDPQFPENFDSQSRVLLNEGVPYRYIPTPDSLEREIVDCGFTVLNRFIRTDSPFGHSSIHFKK
ncbi:arsenite S-adenosylmethyltransferase [compost metagenome]